MNLGELVERADVIRSSACHNLREGKAFRDQLQATIDEAKTTHAKEISKSQARSDDLQKEKQELQRLTEDQAKEIQKLKDELKSSRAEMTQSAGTLKTPRRNMLQKPPHSKKNSSSLKNSTRFVVLKLIITWRWVSRVLSTSSRLTVTLRQALPPTSSTSRIS
ncbi:uncharacterized protein LOC142537941 [Primulina tabacum]|uniref:uncharacterized protein LOC142537941 n=1 Tax=Primulina tabacum TaxID=48773 RepID=UPI003F594A2D